MIDGTLLACHGPFAACHQRSTISHDGLSTETDCREDHRAAQQGTRGPVGRSPRLARAHGYPRAGSAGGGADLRQRAVLDPFAIRAVATENTKTRNHEGT